MQTVEIFKFFKIFKNRALRAFFCFIGFFAPFFATAEIQVQNWQTPEGARVFFVKTQGLPMVDIQLSFDAAASRDGALKGVAQLTNRLIGTRTKYHDEEEIIDGFETVGAEFSRESWKDMAILSLRTLSEKKALNPALSMFAEVLHAPEFSQKYLSRERRRLMRKIDAEAQSPGKIAVRKFAEIVFENHPYQSPKNGDKKSLRMIETADIENHYQNYYVAKNLTIALVGDISKTKAREIARQISHGLPIGKKPEAHPPVATAEKMVETQIDFPSTQTHIYIGQSAIPRNHPDNAALLLANHILGGGGLTSVLGAEIREKHGLAYSVVAYFVKMAAGGYYLIRMQTRNEQAEKSQKLALDALRKFLREGPSDAQIEDAKNHIIGSFSLGVASNADILTYLSIIGFYGLPADYLTIFPEQIAALEKTEIVRAFGKWINPEKLAVVTVGPDG